MEKFYVNFKAFNKKLSKEDNYGPFYEYDSALAFIDNEVCSFLHDWFNNGLIKRTELKITNFVRFNEGCELEVEDEGEKFTVICKIIEEN